MSVVLIYVVCVVYSIYHPEHTLHNVTSSLHAFTPSAKKIVYKQIKTHILKWTSNLWWCTSRCRTSDQDLKPPDLNPTGVRLLTKVVALIHRFCVLWLGLNIVSLENFYNLHNTIFGSLFSCHYCTNVYEGNCKKKKSCYICKSVLTLFQCLQIIIIKISVFCLFTSWIWFSSVYLWRSGEVWMFSCS